MRAESINTYHCAKPVSSAKSERPAKPDRVDAMNNLIAQVRNVFPFAVPEAEICAGKCVGCPKKLLEIVDTELCDWEVKLTNGEIPSFGDIAKLGKLCKNIHRGLKRNNLVS